MPQDIRAGWEADGWQVIEVDGHNLNEIYSALRQATLGKNKPVMILARTVMGKGVSFMENDESYHGAPIKPDQLGNALKELGGIENDLEQLRSRRLEGPPPPFKINRAGFPDVKPGEPIQYGTDDKLDNRSAFGKALLSVADANLSGDSKPVMAVFDCDLAGSVKTTAFGKKYPDSFFQCGIAEHNTAVVAGSLSAERALSVWAAFGMFGITETYNQARLNDINHTNLKLFCTHSGISVGEDGKTHHCIDYFGLLNSTFGWKLITPADPNQTDSVVRHALTNPGNFAVVMGRSTAPVITDEKGLPFFGEKYEYRYGRMEIIRPGEQVALVTSGNMLAVGLDAWNRLTEQGVKAMLVSVSDWSDLHTNDLEMLGGMQEIIVLEDHVVKTGLGTAIGSALLESGFSPRLTKMGVPRYAPSGKAADLYRILGLNAESVANKVKDISERIGINCEVG
ncbi:MAG: hypothetical protein DRP45_10000 [Candidatus Zixiibacteriota bacterium]|nr:MAG: hypothetical protein DRP45_10000 [candidate division Zixibacteria bacterium]